MLRHETNGKLALGTLYC